MVMSALATVLTTAPPIVSSAHLLYETLIKRRERRGPAGDATQAEAPPEVSTAIDEVRSRVESLEASGIDQAKLIAQMAAQEEALSSSLRAVSSHLTALLWVSVSALVVSSVALVLALLR